MCTQPFGCIPAELSLSAERHFVVPSTWAWPHAGGLSPQACMHVPARDRLSFLRALCIQKPTFVAMAKGVIHKADLPTHTCTL